MQYQTISLREEDPRVTLTAYIADERRVVRDALLVLPGGGYTQICSDREGEPIALAFLARGYNTFVLRYSVGEEAVFPRPLVDASLAMQYIRRHADAFCIDPARVFAVGFSAGGHLCAALGTLWNAPELRAALPDLPPRINRPTGMLLCYAVLSADLPATHMGSFFHILGTEHPDREALLRYSLDHCVDAETSPAFLMHTADDAVVPVGNALNMIRALVGHRIPCEARIYARGPHGLALATAATAMGNPELMHPEAAHWVEDADRWMRALPSAE